MGAQADSGALKRGVAILDVLLDATRPLTSREIGEALGLSDSTVHRLLQTLCEAGWVTRAGPRSYHASGKAFLPLSIYHPFNVLRRDAFEPLRALREEFGVTASLIVFVETERLILDVLGVTGMLAPYYGTRIDNPLHVSASGKLLLAALPPEGRDALLGRPPYAAHTPLSRTTRDAVAEDLEQIEVQGFATNIDEDFVGFSAVAAPLFCGPDQVIGCLALAGATERFTIERVPEMGRSLRNSARLTSLGSQSVRAIRDMFVRRR